MNATTRNAFKVGLAIVAAIAIFVFGVRYLEDVPLGGSYEIYSEFERIDGLISGNPVQIAGVRVGNVRAVELNQETGRVRVDMRINGGIKIPVDTKAEITGFAALGGVKLELDTGQSSELVQDGDAIESQEISLLSSVSRSAQPYIDQLDTLMVNLNTTVQALSYQLDEPDSEMLRTVNSINGLTTALNQTVVSERDRLAAVLTRLDQTLASVDRLAATSNDSLAVTLSNLNSTLARTDETLAGLQTATTNLNGLLVRVNSGDGTLGLLARDPALYHSLDSAATNLNALLFDLQNDPKRYLGQLKLVDIF